MIEDPTTEIEALADTIAQQHAAYFVENPKGEIVQTCMIFAASGEAHLIVCGWASAEERDATIGALRMFIEASGATRYAIWAETWFVRAELPKGADPLAAARKASRAYRPGSLAEHPDQIEAVMTLVVDASGLKASRMQEIVRDRKGRVASLKPMDSEAQIGGALAELLPRRSVH
jgi:hypothetical protein